MSLGIIVFSRMKSTRLPGKAMLDFGGKPLVEHVIRRAQKTGYKVVLATSDTKEDDVLEKHAMKIGMNCFRGSEDNVLQRAVLAAEEYGFQAFARLCGDRPFFSVEEMSSFLELWNSKTENNKPDLITNNYPHKAVRGLTTEVIKTSALRSILEANPSKDEKEHLTLRFSNAPELYNIVSIKSDFKGIDRRLGYAIDTKEDYHNALKRIEELSNHS